MMHLLMYLLLLLGIGNANAMELTPQQQRNLGLKTETASAVDAIASERYPAQVVIPNQNQFSIHSPQDGVVSSLLKAEGDRVHAGETVAVINSPQLIAAQSDYLQALVQLQQSKMEWQRQKQLYEEGIIAERRYLETRATYQQANSRVSALEKQLNMAGISESALSDLQRQGEFNSQLKLNASSDGVVMKQSVTIGQHVTAMDKLFDIADLSSLWLEIHVPLERARDVNIGDAVEVFDREIEGDVITIGRQVHDIDQGVMVRAKVDNATDLLVPGEFVQVHLFSDGSGLYRIPQSAVIRLGGEPHVFTQQGNAVEAIKVSVVSQQNNSVVVNTAGQKLNQVVTAGLAALKAAWNNQETP